MRIEIESYMARHGVVKYDITIDDEDVFEGLDLPEMLLIMFDYMTGREGT